MRIFHPLAAVLLLMDVAPLCAQDPPLRTPPKKSRYSQAAAPRNDSTGPCDPKDPACARIGPGGTVIDGASGVSTGRPDANAPSAAAAPPSGTSSSGGGGWNSLAAQSPFSQSGSSGGKVKVTATSSAGARIDCSRADAFITQKVENVEFEATCCAEFVLDMPASSPRRGETASCDPSVSESGFHAFQADWDYDEDKRTWTAQTAVLRNHPYIVPGTYRLVVKDTQGRLYRSGDVVVKRPGFADCNVASASGAGSGGSTSAPSCRWTSPDSVIGPCMGPGCSNPPCSTANRGEQGYGGGGLWTCTCS